MIRLLISLVILIAGNAIGLAVATAMLPAFKVDAPGFVLAVGVLSVVEVFGNPLLTMISISYIPALRGSFALVTTFVGVGLIAYLLDGVSFPDLRTWVLATLLIWLAAFVASLLLPFVFVKRAVGRRTG